MKKYPFLFFALLLFPRAAFAAEIPWDNTLYAMMDNIAAVARPIVAIMVAVSGIMVMLDAGSVNTARIARMTLGIGLSLQVADFVIGGNGIFADLRNIATGVAVKPTMPSISLNGSDQGMNFIGAFMTYYQQMCYYGASILVPSALKILGTLTVVDVTLTLVFKLEGDHIQYMLHTILKVGFYIFLIENWMGGTGEMANLAHTLLTSFEQIGINATGMTELKPESIILNGYEVVTSVVDTLKGNHSYFNILWDLVILVIGLAVFLCVAMTAIEVIVTRLEFYTVALIVTILIPFGAYKHTKFLFEKAIAAMFGLGIKMAMVTFICILADPLLKGLVESFNEAQGWDNLTTLLQLFFGTLILCILAKKIPSMAMGLLNGQPSLGGGDMLSPAKSAANAGMSAAKTAAAGYGALQQASNMAGGGNALKAEGVTGYGLKALAARTRGTMGNLKDMALRENPISESYNATQANIRNKMSRNQRNINANNPMQNEHMEQGGKRLGWRPEMTSSRDEAENNH